MLRAVIIGVLMLALGGIGVVAFVALRPAPPPQVTAVEAAPAPAPVPRRSVLTAAVALRAGALLKAEEIGATPVEAASAAPDVFNDTPATRAEITGGLIRRALAAGEPILASDIVRPGDHGFLAAVLSPGSRAIAIAVDAVTGAAGLIWPGDRVDVILTQTLEDNNTAAARRFAGETILTAVRVIAVDQHIVQGAMETTNAAGGVVASARTVTVEVSARDAERLSVAARIGRLSLTVRSALLQPAPAEAPEPADANPQVPVTWAGDVSGALRGGDGRQGAVNTPLRVFNGPARSEEVRF